MPLLETAETCDGVDYQVVAARPGRDLYEFVIGDDMSTIASL